MTKVAIIDDEVAAVSILTAACKESSIDLNVVGTANTLATGIELIKTEKPEIVLLDVEFPEGTGFEILEEQFDSSFEVIFITAHESYAIEALKHHAFDYILKPARNEEVHKSIAEAVSRINKNEDRDYSKLLTSLQNGSSTRFKLPISDGFRFIDLNDLIYIEADGSYATLHFKDSSRTVASKKLSWFERQLSDQGFLRIHRSYLVNESHIHELHRSDGGYIITSTGTRLGTSKGFKF